MELPLVPNARLMNCRIPKMRMLAPDQPVGTENTLPLREIATFAPTFNFSVMTRYRATQPSAQLHTNTLQLTDHAKSVVIIK